MKETLFSKGAKYKNTLQTYRSTAAKKSVLSSFFLDRYEAYQKGGMSKIEIMQENTPPFEGRGN